MHFQLKEKKKEVVLKRQQIMFLHQNTAALNLSVLAWLSCTQMMQHLMVQSPFFQVTLGQFF